MRALCLIVSILSVASFSPAASAQVADSGSLPRPELDPDPGWAVGLDAYGGIAALYGSEEDLAHTFGGGMLKGRWNYIQAGAFAEVTDVVIDQWLTVGGLAGVYAPFSRWVDFDASLGLGARRYSDTDARYGPGGYSLTNPVLLARVGVSDRSSEALFGARIGGQIVFSVDLDRKEAPWRRVFGAGTEQERIAEGITRVGGVSLGLLLSVGFDFGPDRSPPE